MCHIAPQISDYGMFWIWGFPFQRGGNTERAVQGQELCRTHVFLQPWPLLNLPSHFYCNAPSTPPILPSQDLLKFLILTTLPRLKLKNHRHVTSSPFTQIHLSPATALHSWPTTTQTLHGDGFWVPNRHLYMKGRQMLCWQNNPFEKDFTMSFFCLRFPRISLVTKQSLNSRVRCLRPSQLPHLTKCMLLQSLWTICYTQNIKCSSLTWTFV